MFFTINKIDLKKHVISGEPGLKSLHMGAESRTRGLSYLLMSISHATVKLEPIN